MVDPLLQKLKECILIHITEQWPGFPRDFSGFKERDWKKLSELIDKKIDDPNILFIRITTKSLKNWFQKERFENRPRQSNLDILSQFLGYSNWDDFLRNNSVEENIKENTEENLVEESRRITGLSAYIFSRKRWVYIFLLLLFAVFIFVNLNPRFIKKYSVEKNRQYVSYNDIFNALDQEKDKRNAVLLLNDAPALIDSIGDLFERAGAYLRLIRLAHLWNESEIIESSWSSFDNIIIFEDKLASSKLIKLLGKKLLTLIATDNIESFEFKKIVFRRIKEELNKENDLANCAEFIDVYLIPIIAQLVEKDSIDLAIECRNQIFDNNPLIEKNYNDFRSGSNLKIHLDLLRIESILNLINYEDFIERKNAIIENFLQGERDTLYYDRIYYFLMRVLKLAREEQSTEMFNAIFKDLTDFNTKHISPNDGSKNPYEKRDLAAFLDSMILSETYAANKEESVLILNKIINIKEELPEIYSSDLREALTEFYISGAYLRFKDTVNAIQYFRLGRSKMNGLKPGRPFHRLVLDTARLLAPKLGERLDINSQI